MTAFALFATELDVADQTLALGGWIGGLLGLVSTLVSGYLSYRLSRDRLSFDADVVALKGRVKELERDVDEAKKDSLEAKKAEERALQAEKQCRAEVAEVRAELRQIRDQVFAQRRANTPPPAAL